MLKLKNIKKNNGIISAEYEPEASGELGKIAIDIKTGEVIESVETKHDEVLPIYLHHAIYGLKELISQKELPNEQLIMWY